MTTQTDTIELETGDLVEGKYRIGELIAEGGMGRLYRAVQEPLGRDVAIKIIKLEGATDEKREKWQGRFFREAKLASRLNHPNTVTIIDYGEYQQVGLYLVMEFLDGVSLRETLTHYGVLNIDMAVHIAVQIANSLADAHSAGIVHRDLKPPNVMLMRRGDDPCFVKVVDFGLVKELDPDQNDDELTGENAIVGSPTYMAPERFLEKDADYPAVDIYALGVVLYEMIVGRAPFVRGEDSTLGNLMMQHVSADPPPMSQFKPGLKLPEGLENLIMRCLAKNPTDRYESMDFVLKLLRSCEASISDNPASHSAQIGFESSAIVPGPTVADRITSNVPQTEEQLGGRTSKVIPAAIVASLVAILLGAWLFFATQNQRVQIVTSPTGAQVFDGEGVVIGVTPLVVDRDLFPSTEVKIEQQGFQPMTVSIPESDEKIVKLSFALEPEPKPIEIPIEKPTVKEDPKSNGDETRIEPAEKPKKPKNKPDIKLSR